MAKKEKRVGHMLGAGWPIAISLIGIVAYHGDENARIAIDSLGNTVKTFAEAVSPVIREHPEALKYIGGGFLAISFIRILCVRAEEIIQKTRSRNRF